MYRLIRASDATRASSSLLSKGLVTKSSARDRGAPAAVRFRWPSSSRRKEFRLRRGSDPPADLVPVHARHHDVEQDEIDVLGLEQGASLRLDGAAGTRDPRGAGRRRGGPQTIGRLCRRRPVRVTELHQITRLFE